MIMSPATPSRTITPFAITSKTYYRPNFRVKSRDCATPLGPWLVDAADVADPMNLQLAHAGEWPRHASKATRAT